MIDSGSVNDAARGSDVAVGRSLTILFAVSAWLYTAPAFGLTMADLGTLGGDGGSSAAVGVSGGQVVGYSTGSGTYRAFRWTQVGGLVDLGTLGGTYSEATAESSGQVVGASSISGDAEYHAFSWTQAGGMVDLGTLGGTQSYALAVSGGQV